MIGIVFDCRGHQLGLNKSIFVTPESRQKIVGHVYDVYIFTKKMHVTDINMTCLNTKHSEHVLWSFTERDTNWLSPRGPKLGKYWSSTMDVPYISRDICVNGTKNNNQALALTKLN
jgi:hypothetical protein